MLRKSGENEVKMSNCRFCGKRFTIKKNWQKYCSAPCRTKAWDKKHPRVLIED